MPRIFRGVGNAAQEALPNGVTVESWFTTEVDRKQLEQLTVADWQAELFKEGEARFTQRARSALQQAIALAQSFGHNYVGTEHLLWGLTSERDGLAAKLLSETGVTPITLNQAAIARFGAPPPTEIGTGSSARAMPQLVPRVIQVLELANVTREETGARYIGTEHLLLGILREGSGMAVTLLQDLAVDLAALEQQLLTTVSGKTQ